MKKIKILFSALLSLLSAILCFSLVGCADEKGEFISDSLDYKFTNYTTLREIDVEYSFDVTTPNITNYNVKYTITVYYNNVEIESKNETKTISPNQDKKHTIKAYYDFLYSYSDHYVEQNLTLKITNVSVTPKEQKDDYQNYAIGFGTAGGAVLIACTVLFIVLKVKEKK